MPRALADQLIHYLADAHAIEEQALQQLRAAPKAASDPLLAEIFDEHRVETEAHERAVRARLEAHGAGPSRVKDLVMRAGGVGFVLFARAQPDTPGKLLAHAYSYEHLELAAYELLMRVAERAEDAKTVAEAHRIRDEEARMAERLAGVFDRAVERSLRVAGHDDVDKALGRYLGDAHAIESQALKLLEKAPARAGSPALASVYREHAEQTRGHLRAIEQRLEARSQRPSKVKDGALTMGALSWATFFELHPDTSGKLAAFSFAFEHLEIAAYEELRRVADRADDAETVATAERILAEERAAAAKVAEHFDDAVDSALAEVGVAFSR